MSRKTPSGPESGSALSTERRKPSRFSWWLRAAPIGVPLVICACVVVLRFVPLRVIHAYVWWVETKFTVKVPEVRVWARQLAPDPNGCRRFVPSSDWSSYVRSLHPEMVVLEGDGKWVRLHWLRHRGILVGPKGASPPGLHRLEYRIQMEDGVYAWVE
jgi:hypothetical protein